MLPVILRNDAEVDIRRAYEELKLSRIGLGGKFQLRLIEILTRIERHPNLYAMCWRDVRAVRINALDTNGVVNPFVP